jgi:hypothetical protein
MFADVKDRFLKRKDVKSLESFEALAAAWKSASQGNKVFYVIADKAVAVTIIAMLTHAFPVWSTEGVTGGARKRGAKGLAARIKESFRIALPADLREDAPATPKAEAVAVAAARKVPAGKAPVVPVRLPQRKK